MKNRFVAILLALVLGTFGLHKFYLGRKAECGLCVLFCWTGIPLVAGVSEAVSYVKMTPAEWDSYVVGIQGPSWYSDTRALWAYIIPIGFVCLSIGLATTPPLAYASVLTLVAVWLYPSGKEEIIQNRFRDAKERVWRLVATGFVWILVLMAIFSDKSAPVPPQLSLLSESAYSGSGGSYKIEIEALPSDSASIWNVPMEKTWSGRYSSVIQLPSPSNAVTVTATNGEEKRSAIFVITRWLNAQEAAEASIRQREAKKAEEATKAAAKSERVKWLQEAVSVAKTKSNPASYYEDQKNINEMRGLISNYFVESDEARQDWDADISKLWSQLESATLSMQKREMPKIRKWYGTVLGKMLWTQDIEVRVWGRDNAEITLICWRYANNQAKLNAHVEFEGLLSIYRFKQANYKWADLSSWEYTYWKIDSPSDSVR